LLVGGIVSGVIVLLVFGVVAAAVWWPYYIERTEYARSTDRYRFTTLYCTPGGTTIYAHVTHSDGDLREAILRHDLFELHGDDWEVSQEVGNLPNHPIAMFTGNSRSWHRRPVIALVNDLVRSGRRREAADWARRGLKEIPPMRRWLCEFAGYPEDGFDSPEAFERWWSGPNEIRFPPDDEPVRVWWSAEASLDAFWDDWTGESDL